MSCFFCACAPVRVGASPPSTTQTEPSPLPSSPVIEGVWQTDDVDLSRVRRDKKLVALTFDDAPTKELGALLDVFLDFNERHPDCPATATLFCNGRGFSSRAKEHLFTAFSMGFELGNHAFSHLRLTTLSPSEIERQIGTMDALLQEIDGKPLHLFRAPYGEVNQTVKQTVEVPVIDWYIDTEDWANLSPSLIVDRAFDRLQDGAILLLHDGYESTVEGVRRLLPALFAAGYQAVSVSQMAKAHDVVLRVGSVYTRARKRQLSPSP